MQGSSVKNVTLYYTNGNGTAWISGPMSPNTNTIPW